MREAVPHQEAAPAHPARERRDAELRLYGMNAVQAVFARRPQALRKLYLSEARIPQLQPLLKWCVANRVGYRVVDDGDLQKLAASAHHEGVVAEVLREEPLPLSSWLRAVSYTHLDVYKRQYGARFRLQRNPAADAGGD